MRWQAGKSPLSSVIAEPAAGLERRHVGHLLGRNEIAPPHLGAVEIELLGDAVEQPLHAEGGFRIASAAHRHGGHLVGLDHEHLELVGRQQVGAGQAGRRVVGQVDALRRIGALVVDHPAAHAEQAPVAVERDLEIPILVALLHGGEKMLAPVLDPFDRPPQEEARGRQRHLLGIHDELGAEAAADIGRDHADLVLVEAEHFIRKPRTSCASCVDDHSVSRSSLTS